MTSALPEVLEKLERATPGPWYWTTNRDSIQSYVDGKNEVILWPANALSGDNLDWDHREKDGPFEGYPEWYARLGACGHRSEKDAAANAEAIIAAVNFLREHGPALLRDAGDAARYRWLRAGGYEHADDGLPHIVVTRQGSWGNWHEAIIEDDEADAAIDAAMHAPGGAGGGE